MRRSVQAANCSITLALPLQKFDTAYDTCRKRSRMQNCSGSQYLQSGSALHAAYTPIGDARRRHRTPRPSAVASLQQMESVAVVKAALTGC